MVDQPSVDLFEIFESGFKVISECVLATGRLGWRDGIYRGQADKEWLIQPTAFRKPFGIMDKVSLRRWISEARRLNLPAARNYIEWLVLARHYGVPTPLLDWTSNPLIALFFACSSDEDDGSKSKDGIIYAQSRNYFTEFWDNDSIDPFLSRKEPALFDASTMNNRSTAQDSLMTLHSKCCSKVDNRKILIDIPASQKEAVLYALPFFGIVDSRLFADFSLAARRYQQVESQRFLIQSLTKFNAPVASEPPADENDRS